MQMNGLRRNDDAIENQSGYQKKHFKIYFTAFSTVNSYAEIETRRLTETIVEKIKRSFLYKLHFIF